MIANNLIVFGVLSMLPSTILADLTCTQYFPQGKHSNTGVLQFTGQGAENYVPTTNAQAANPVILNTNNPSGTTLKFESCSSSSLGFAPYNTGDGADCDDSGCERDFVNYIRVINPASGNCLTMKPAPAGVAGPGYSEIYFSKCNPNPTTTAQIFQSYQSVEYGYNFQGIREYYPSYLGPFGDTPVYNPYYWLQSSWVMGNDAKTLLLNPPSTGETSDCLLAVIVTQR